MARRSAARCRTFCERPSHQSNFASRESRLGVAPAYIRRLSGKILLAFAHACENDELEVAAQLLRILDMMVARQTLYPARARHQVQADLVAAQRLLGSGAIRDGKPSWVYAGRRGTPTRRDSGTAGWPQREG